MVFVANVDGTAMRPLFQLQTSTRFLQTVGSVLSADDKVIYSFTRPRPSAALPVGSLINPWAEIVGVDVATGATVSSVKLPDGGYLTPHLTISPNGETFAIMGTNRDGLVLTAMRTDGTEYRVLYGPFASAEFYRRVNFLRCDGQRTARVLC